jgi:hypothetical protein
LTAQADNERKESAFTVNNDGALVPPADSRAVLPHGVHWSLANTSPDWLLFLRTKPVGGVAEMKPRVVMAGDCGTFPVSDLIAFLGQSRWSGLVRMSAPDGDRALTLKDGEVRAASSDASSDRIGDVMVRLGYVTRKQLEDVLRENPPSRVGRALVDQGLLKAHDLWKCVTEQVSEIFHQMMLTKEGSFALIDQDVGAEKSHNLNLSMQSLLMDSIRKIDEMALFRKRIPHGRMYAQKKKPSDGSLEPEEDKMLAALDGQHNVFELGQMVRLSEFDATRVLYRLLEGGFASVSQTPIGGAPATSTAPQAAAASTPAGGPTERKVMQVFNGIFKEVRNEVATRGKLESFLQSANAALSSGTLSPSPMLQGVAFEADGTLPEEKVIALYTKHAPSLGSEPVANFRQALSDVMFFLLFQAGELLESHADEDLARRVKELLATLDQ